MIVVTSTATPPPASVDTSDPTRSTRAQRQAEVLAHKPAARGFIHAVAAPLALANGICLIVFGHDAGQKISAAVFMCASLVLFAFSAVYHIGDWNQRVKAIMRKIDHSNIFVLIAGTYTPLTWVLLDGWDRAICLTVVWTGAVLGTFMHVYWTTAPRWLNVLLYVAVGWVAVWYLPQIWDAGGPAIVWLVAAGGIVYTIGALFYALKWPNPWPRAFGFHEFFHLCTFLGFACHAVAIWLTFFKVS